MTVKKMAAISRYIGLSGDDKPTGVPVGSTFKEYDSKDRYITHDGTNWVLQDQDDPLLPFAGMGMGRTYYVNNISGDSGNSGLSWGSAFAQVSEAISASETYRELGSGTPGVTTNDYVANTIAIQGTGTAYTTITNLGERCYIFGVSAGLHRDGGSGQVRIGSNTTDGYDGTANARGNTIYNIQFQGGGNDMYCFRNTAWIQRSRFTDVTFMQAGAELEGCFYTANMSGSVFERCTFTSNSPGTSALYGMQLAGACSDDHIVDCIFAVGSTALVSLSNNIHVNTVFARNFFTGDSAVGFLDADTAGHAMVAGNWFQVTGLTNAITRVVNNRTVGNMVSGTADFVSD